MRNSTLPLLAVVPVCFLLCAGCHQPVDIRNKLLAEARSEYPGSLDGGELKLINFEYLGSLTTRQGPLYVAVRKSVITGMLSPRGIRSLLFFDKDFHYAHEIFTGAQFLGCIGPKLYLFGKGQLETESGTQEYNVIDFENGIEYPQFRLEDAFAMYVNPAPLN